MGHFIGYRGSAHGVHGTERPGVPMITDDYISIGIFLPEYGADHVVNGFLLQMVVNLQFELGAATLKPWTSAICDI